MKTGSQGLWVTWYKFSSDATDRRMPGAVGYHKGGIGLPFDVLAKISSGRGLSVLRAAMSKAVCRMRPTSRGKLWEAWRTISTLVSAIEVWLELAALKGFLDEQGDAVALEEGF